MPSIATVSARQLYGGNVPGLGYGAWNNMYSTRAGVSTGNVPGGNAAMTSGPAGAATAQADANAPGATGGSIGAAFIGLVVLLALAWYFAHKSGNASEFSNIKASALNIFLITFNAIIGIFVLKLIVSKFPIPGVTQVILAA